MAKWKSYRLDDLEGFIQKLVNEHNYAEIIIDEGCLGLGRRILLPPPDAKKYAFLIRELYLNEWSSANQMMKVRDIPKKWYEEAKEFIEESCFW